VVVHAGEEVVVPPGSYHRFANAGEDPAGHDTAPARGVWWWE
jgi:quercetin dioxygenase-like cupin family protein